MIKGKNLEIERLRAFAVLSVILYHIGVNFPRLFPSDFGSPNGVDLFFVISGFVVSKSLLDSLRLSNKRRIVASFYVRRAFRILPLAFACMAYYMAIYLIAEKSGKPNLFADVPESIKAILTLRFNYFLAYNPKLYSLGFFWTLMVEEHFYLLLPLLLVVLNTNSKRLWSCLGGILLVRLVLRPSTALFASGTQLTRLLIFGTHARLDMLFLGVALNLFQTTFPGFSIGRAFRPLFHHALSWIALAGIFLSPSFSVTKWSLIPNRSVLILCGLLVYQASLELNAVFFVGKFNKILEFLGSRSFGLYLWHGPVIGAMALYLSPRTGVSSAATVVMFALAATVLVTEICYRMIERPCLILGKTLSQRIVSDNFSISTAY